MIGYTESRDARRPVRQGQGRGVAEGNNNLDKKGEAEEGRARTEKEEEKNELMSTKCDGEESRGDKGG